MTVNWNGTGIQNIGTLLAGINSLTAPEGGFGLLGVSIIFLVWIMVYLRLRNEPTREAAVAASFVSLVVSVFLAILGMIEKEVFGAALILFLGAIVLLINRDGG